MSRMKKQSKVPNALFFVPALLLISSFAHAQSDPLPSWNDTAPKNAIIAFIERVTTPGSSDFVPGPERIAVFDNDGTLWAEQPIYVQAVFIFDRIEQLAPQHPEWNEKEPFASVLKGDFESALAQGEQALLEMAMATHAGMTTEEFGQIVLEWLASARHPITGSPYTEMIYQPMFELLAYLRANEFKTFIVSGGGIAFMRPWAESVYGVPPEQVIGSSIRTTYEVRNGGPVLARLPELNFFDDAAGKPVAINQHIGRRPIMAFGNSDGDFEMLEWTTAGAGPRFGLLVHHTDADREWAYDRESHVGRLARGLDEGPRRGWIIMNMRDDWKVLYLSELR